MREAMTAAEKIHAADFDERHRKWEAEKLVAEAARKAWETDVKEAIDKGFMAPPLPAGAEIPNEPKRPSPTPTASRLPVVQKILRTAGNITMRKEIAHTTQEGAEALAALQTLSTAFMTASDMSVVAIFETDGVLI